MTASSRPAIAGAALLLYLVLALAFLRAPLCELDTRIASDGGAHQFELGMPSFWHASMAYPVRWAATLRDLCSPYRGPAALAELRRLGVTDIVAQRELLRRSERPEFTARLAVRVWKRPPKTGPSCCSRPSRPAPPRVLDRPWGGWYVGQAPTPTNA